MRGILIDENGDLMIRNGSMVIGDNRMDIVERLLIAWQGEFKEAPLLGGNIKNDINGTPNVFWSGEVKKQIKQQGIDVKDVIVVEEGVQVVIND